MKSSQLLQFKILIFLNIILFILLPSSRVYAEVWSVSLQNDIVVGTDERYTNGISFEWMSGIIDQKDLSNNESHYIDFVVSTVSFLPLVNIDAEFVTVAFKIGQDIYTPRDTTRKDLIEDDVPYAGHLYTKYSLFEWREDEVEETYFQFGIVGPSSGAECSQKAFHSLIGNDEPQGWDNQLPDYPTFGIGYANAYNIWQSFYRNGLYSDWVPSYGFEIGNFLSGLSTGLMFRFGDNYPVNQAPIFGSVHEGLNSRLVLNPKNFSQGWAINVGAYFDAVAHSHVIDSSEKHTITRKALAGMVTVGFALYLNNIQLFFSVQSVNMYVNGHIFTHGWGGITFSISD